MKNVLIVGMGKSGRSVYASCIKNGDLPFFYDDNLEHYDTDNLNCKLDYAVVSPAVNPRSKIMGWLTSGNVPVIPEIEYAYNNIKNINEKVLIGITGTNGKTTVTTMLHHILGDESCSLCGNVGIPLTDCAEDKKRYMAIELSSFQLLPIKNFKVNIACILNLMPDHLEYHSDIDEYYGAKLNITKNLTADDYLVVYNNDKEIQNRIKNTKANIFYFGKDISGNGCYLEGADVYFSNNGIKERVLTINVNEVFEHNILNMLAVCTILKICGVDNDTIKEGFKTYKYAPFRLEYVKKINNTLVYNDSKSTNVASLKSALSCFDGKVINLIIGGRYKNESFKDIFLNGNNINKVCIFGESKEKIKEYADAVGYRNYVICDNLTDAVNESVKDLNGVDILLFSPACASFDMYSGYEERGKHFNEIINKIK